MRTKVRSLNFKWNPFTLAGEAPASMRFFPDDNPGEIEFASKEDLAIINTNPELQRVHKSMLVGVQKKFQSYNEEKKNLQTQVETLTNQVNELDEYLQEWEGWGEKNKGLIDKIVKAGSTGSIDDGKGGKGKGGQVGDDERYNKLIEEINRGAQQMMNNFQLELGKRDRMLKLSMQLGLLARKHPEMDENKVLDIAIKKGYTDLDKAYEDKEAYGEELFNKEVETRLKPRVEEEIAKRNTNVESGSGAIPTTFELPKEMPKSFTDAGDRFLAEREKEAAKP